MTMNGTITTITQQNGTVKHRKKHEDDLINNNVEEDKNITIPQPLPYKIFGGLIEFRTRVVWINAVVFLLLHLSAFYGVWICLRQMVFEYRFKNFIYVFILMFLGGEGITVGAHRLWTHKSFKARRPLRIILIILQTLAGENSCWTWVRDHRIHHKYTDTNADPHNASRGFFYSHVGWLMMKKHPETREKEKSIFMEDIERDPVVMFQKRNFMLMFIPIGVILPIMGSYCLFEQTFWEAVFTAFAFRYVCLLNITWTVNSLAHIYGYRPYDKNILPSENIFVSLIANGEGWHNYHHVFPWDYKASEYAIKLNVTRYLIEFFQKVGLAYDLKEATSDMIEKRMARTGDGSYCPDQVVFNHKVADTKQQNLGW